MPKKKVRIIGAGLAGSEAAYFLAQKGIEVILHEMRPKKSTEAHKTGQCAELVCSNSLKSKEDLSGPGILKAEMKAIGSLILEAAAVAEVPGGQALTVDRDIFSDYITDKLKKHPLIQFQNEEITEPLFEEPTLIATGPLTSEGLGQWLGRITHQEDLYFYDAIAPIIEATSIDPNHCFLANRYDKGGEEAYLNCPLNEEEYTLFIETLLMAEKVAPKNFEKEKFFQGCQPIEAIAATGKDSLRYGPMKPVGLTDPKTGRYPYAVVQLRPENKSKTAYNMVGFQTKLKYGEQKKVFSLIPALKNAEFLRLGSIHRNTYVCSPKVLRPDLSLIRHPHIYLAGQITGVEGYLESAACGLLSALFISQRVLEHPHSPPPGGSALGSLLRYIIASDIKNFQPANIHFGLFEPLLFENCHGLKKDLLRKEFATQSAQNIQTWIQNFQ